MKKIVYSFVALTFLFAGCAENDLEISPNDKSFPFRIILDAEEGAGLAGEDEYDLEIKFADFTGDLPEGTITLQYEIEGEESFNGTVEIDKIVYEVEIDDCVYERELDFDAEAQTITITSDSDLESLPESFEIVFSIPDDSDVEGGFKFSLTGIEAGNANVILGAPYEFEYQVLDSEVAGEWYLALESSEDFERFKNTFGVISPELLEVNFEDITGNIILEFGFEEVQIEIELNETEEVCSDGEIETENKTIEIEAEYEAEDGELKFEGSHFIIGDDGEIEDELDFELEGVYSLNPENGSIEISINVIIDEDNYEEGEELFTGEELFLFYLD